MIVQDPSVLLAESGAQLTARSLDAYAELLRSDVDLERGHFEAFEYAVVHKVLGGLAREQHGQADVAELMTLFGELRRLAASAEDRSAEYSLRWLAQADLLDGRLKVLAAQAPERALTLLHAREICEFVQAKQVVPQAHIKMKFGLGAANLSRILGVLEGHDLIARRASGRTKDVFPGRRLEEALGPMEQVARPTTVRSGRRLFSLPA